MGVDKMHRLLTCHHWATVNRQQSTVNSQQSTINSQQSTVNNQQSTVKKAIIHYSQRITEEGLRKLQEINHANF
ncbi:MAG: hypothetical protein F6K31_20555 [Symploca sp. SIO2G7]|nr:hypothetical protein [Symploca sp. SIO2G7]